MSTEIAKFQYPLTGQEVRSTDFDGEPWVLVSDVCAVLAHSNPAKAVADHVDPEDVKRATLTVREGSRMVERERAFVNESGLYALIFGSRLPAAKDFKRWITSEVLPAIRQTGSYSVTPRLPDLTTPEGVLALAEMAAQTARDLIASETARKEMEPKAIAHDTYLAAGGGDRILRRVAKLLGLKEMDLRRFLLDQKLIYHYQAPCGQHQYDAYAAHVKHFKPVETTVEHTWGPCNHYTLYIRPSGVEFIRRRLDAETARHRAALAAASTPKEN